MQAIFKPSNIPDQRTHYHFTQAQVDEWNRREAERNGVAIKPSETALEVKRRIARSKSPISKKAPDK